ncbi:glycine betaine/proline transport system substrate-binding protein [Sphaerotilus natans subsp. natans DSM 6575]|uniref:Glycine betaine/proline transport system substrate-binding protein n=1 Tax=Sphaerotilus natans subsp. natans DSM 6575 TaxID=1286631 RepID=A0A059KIV8_9BURK|nr:glycine betaine ABC transporter substrate-binding protein [Sphaerotilus natans]KDB51407.1 glycine betaine/proline transport system substrate-binding protein [Sphaerotilus natans subsp. natans DSM 6575]SIR79303.1 glycine betaine/proline transport system substrate-binding protein [Sphaerotilus natans]
MTDDKALMNRRHFLAGATTTLALAGTPLSVLAQAKPIRIGWTAWSDAEAVTNIAKLILEQRLAQKVELVMTDVALQYAGLERGQIDLMLMAWLPGTHQAYYDKVKGTVENLGALYTDAKLGWAVPADIPVSTLKTIEDLKKPEVMEKLGGKIQGIDAGAGLMKLSEAAIKTYGLDYKLMTASDAAMVSALDRAIQRKQWIVVTTWSPHWMFSQYKLRYLEDPKQALGGAESIHALARKGFSADFPAAAAFIRNLKISLADLEGVMLKARDSNAAKEAAAYIASHGDQVNRWVAAAGK